MPLHEFPWVDVLFCALYVTGWVFPCFIEDVARAYGPVLLKIVFQTLFSLMQALFMEYIVVSLKRFVIERFRRLAA